MVNWTVSLRLVCYGAYVPSVFFFGTRWTRNLVLLDMAIKDLCCVWDWGALCADGARDNAIVICGAETRVQDNEHERRSAPLERRLSWIRRDGHHSSGFCGAVPHRTATRLSQHLAVPKANNDRW